MTNENSNGYVIYPDSIQVPGGLYGARQYCIEQSAENRNEEYRIESCDDEKVIARYRRGEEVTR